MTALGKILVFFNLVFSLVVGAFAVVDYTARTHYAKGLDELEKGLTIATLSRDTWRMEANRLADIQKKLDARLKAEGGPLVDVVKDSTEPGTAILQAITVAQDRSKALEAKLDKALRDIKQQTDKASEAHAASVAAQAEVMRREADVKQARQAYSDQVRVNNELLDKMKKARDELVRAEIGKKAALDRLDDITRDLADARALVRTLKAGKTTASRPPDNVEGLVKQVDPNSKLLTITLGSDAGLARGHRLYVFRLGRNAQYLGEVEMVEVGRASSVAQLVGKARQPIRVDDRVGTSIVGGN